MMSLIDVSLFISSSKEVKEVRDLKAAGSMCSSLLLEKSKLFREGGN